MSSRPGATVTEWAHWDLTLGLTPDLLPVVCQPGLPIAPKSTLKSYGKVPSHLTVSGEVMGIAKWTSRVSSGVDVERWMKEPRYGICLQTRRIRALDVDVDDPFQARVVMLEIIRGCQAFAMAPVRSRPNSGKFLLLFELLEDQLSMTLRGTLTDLPKQTLVVQGGMIELLGTGQQCLVAGTHPSGQRYTWDWSAIPTISLPQLTHLQLHLHACLSPGEVEGWSEARVAHEGEVDPNAPPVHDPVAHYLHTHELVLGTSPQGRLYLTCPWKSHHTTDSDMTQTAYFPAGTGGYAMGHFDCRHAGCSGKTDADFLDALGYTLEGFEPLTSDAMVYGDPDDLVGAATQSLSPIEGPAYSRDLKTGKIKPLLNNFLLWLRDLPRHGDAVRFDVFRDELTWHTPEGARPFTDADYTRMRSRAEAEGFMPLHPTMIRDAVRLVAQEACYDSAQNWLDALPAWDGIDRLSSFCATYLGAAPSAYATSVGRYLWTAMAGRIRVPGAQTDMCVILVSGQGTGKSTSVRTMAPCVDYYAEVSLSDNDADRARLTRGKTLIELAELRGLHTKDMESIKAFVTRRDDEWVPKYFEMRTTYRRRFVMIGTTNDEEMLADSTGARRWLPLRVGIQDIQALRRDHLQLWAQAKDLEAREGIAWQDAHTLAQDEHAKFMVSDAWEDVIRDWLRRPGLDGVAPADARFVRITDIMGECLRLDMGRTRKIEQVRIADILKSLGYERRVLRVNGDNTKVWTKIGKKLQ